MRTPEQPEQMNLEQERARVMHETMIKNMAYVYSKILSPTLTPQKKDEYYDWLNDNCISPEGEYILGYDDWVEVMAFEESEVKKLKKLGMI